MNPASSPRPAAGFGERAVLGIVSLATLVFTGYYFGLRGGQPSTWNDTYEYAQAARNLATGRGLRSDASTVLEVGLFGAAPLPLPYFLHDAGNSVLMAAAFRLLGPTQSAIGLVAGGCFVLLAPLTYVLGRRVFGAETALLAGLLVAVNTQLLIYAGAGYSETPIAFFLTLLFLLLLQETAWGHLFAGAAFGALVLLRANALPILPWVLAFVGATVPGDGGGTKRVRGMVGPILMFLLGLVCVLAPNAARNRHWTGRAGFALSASSLLHHTGAMSGKATDAFSRPPAHVDALAYVLAHPQELLRKMGWQGYRELEGLLRGGQLPRGDFVSAILAPLFLFALLFPPGHEGPARRRFRWLVAACAFTVFLVGTAFHLRWRHLYAFFPAAILFAADELMRLAQGRRFGPRVSAAFFVVLAVALGVGPVLDTVGTGAAFLDRRDRFYRKLGGFVTHHTDAEAVILLDVTNDRFNPTGNALAWHTRRTLVEYDPYTLESAPIRRSSRPLAALRVSLAERPAVNQGDANAPAAPEVLGFRPLATFTHDLGTATLLCRPGACPGQE